MTSKGTNDQCLEEPEGNSGDQDQIVQDLTSSMSTNDESSQSTSQNSPKKQPNPTEQPNTPTKSSRNRRRKEARHGRNANQSKKHTNDSSNSRAEKAAKPRSPTISHDESPSQPQKSNQPIQEAIQEAQSRKSPTTQQQDVTGCNTNKNFTDTNSWRRRQNEFNKERSKEIKDLRESLKLRETQLQNLAERFKLQVNKIKQLESTVLSTTKTCNQFEKLLQQELINRSRLETENEGLNQSISRLKAQIGVHEKNKFNNDELVRVLNATLMERETEVSILKLKMTRMQTNPSSNVLSSNTSISSIKQDPCRTYATTGRSNSEFCRNSYIRSSMIAEAASTRASTTHLRGSDRDASVWATVPEELTPSKRPQMLEKNLQPLYGSNHYSIYDRIPSPTEDHSSTPLSRDRNHRTLPISTKNNRNTIIDQKEVDVMYSQPNAGPKTDMNLAQHSFCQVTNLDDTNSTTQSSGNKTFDSSKQNDSKQSTPSAIVGTQDQKFDESESKGDSSMKNKITSADNDTNIIERPAHVSSTSHYSTISNNSVHSAKDITQLSAPDSGPPSLPQRTPSTSMKLTGSFKKIFGKLARTDSSSNSHSKTDLTTASFSAHSSPFRRGANRSTMATTSSDIRAHISPRRQISFQTDKPFAEWDTDMLVDWLTMIGLSMYTTNCRRWVRCGAHIMNATPAEVDKVLGITNHLHRKKLRLAISELNGDCDKVTKAASKLDYLWVARWLDDIGLPQYKEAFINARIDGRVLNYLTVEDLVSMNVKSLLHHASIRYGIRVLRSINFDLQLLKRRATAEEAEQMNTMRQQLNQVNNTLPLSHSSDDNVGEVTTWTCHRVMEWLRMIDFAEFAPNLRGSGVHGGLIVFEDGFNIETMCTLLSIPSSRTLLRRHLSTFFESLVGKDLILRKSQNKDMPSSQQLNPSAEIKTNKKSPLWFSKLKSSKVAQDGMDEYLCPMYPVEPQLIKNPSRKSESVSPREGSQLSKIPESINV